MKQDKLYWILDMLD